MYVINLTLKYITGSPSIIFSWETFSISLAIKVVSIKSGLVWDTSFESSPRKILSPTLGTLPFKVQIWLGVVNCSSPTSLVFMSSVGGVLGAGIGSIASAGYNVATGYKTKRVR